jgi:hypothetical protein
MGEIVASEGITIPTSPADRKKLKGMIAECTHCLQRIDDQREAMKDIVDVIIEEFSIPRKIANKLARTMYKRDYENVQQENEDFEQLYETIVESQASAANLSNALSDATFD